MSNPPGLVRHCGNSYVLNAAEIVKVSYYEKYNSYSLNMEIEVMFLINFLDGVIRIIL